MTSVIYTDSPSGYEIVLLSASGIPAGIAYDPRRAAMPIPWHRDCHHCLAGRQTRLSIQVKRAIQLIRTITENKSSLTYTVPTNSRPHQVIYWTDKSGIRRAVITSDPTPDRQKPPVLEVSAEPNSELIFSGNLRDFQAPILHRCLKMIFSQREAKMSEVIAATRPLVEMQKKIGIPTRRQNRCNTIDWISLVSELKQTQQT